jgi:enoyl-CoA hydratase/carnithine racemase
MTYATLQIERTNGVALVVLNRPDKKNAMNPQLHETNALEELRCVAGKFTPGFGGHETIKK